jgi:hypothetical protein
MPATQSADDLLLRRAVVFGERSGTVSSADSFGIMEGRASRAD